MPNHSTVNIIGAGPAGIAAAIQLRRFGIDFKIFNDSSKIGGLLRNANILENIPSFYKGISAKEYLKNLKKHLKEFDINVSKEHISLIDYNENIFNLKGNTNSYTSDYLIIATGTKPIISEDLILPKSKNIKYEIWDILKEKNKNIVIVGAGDAAFDYALNLSKKNNVIILNRKSQIKSLEILVKRALKNKSIQYFDNTFIYSVEKSGETLFLTCKNEQSFLICADYLIFAIGRTPNYPEFSEIMQKSHKELLNNNKLFEIGDLINGRVRQSSLAIGDGIKSAMQIGNLESSTHQLQVIF